MRAAFSTVVAAAVGGGITAAMLLATGVVPRERAVTAGAPRALTAPAAAAVDARAIYRRDAPGVVFVRARTLRTDPGPYDVFDVVADGEATGSGFVLDADGLILTNAHVVADAIQVGVRFSDTRTARATVVGADADTDLALLRVDPEGLDLRPLELGSSAGVAVGDPTVAIGNPLGVERTLTTGVVSALRRRLTAPSGFGIDDVIQTDAALNPGTSGGPLLDADGKVIGINSQIAAGAGAVGFAVPVDTVKEIIPLLERDGRVVRPYLGIGGGLAADGGVHVQRIQPGSPAAAAGLKAGETLTRLDGRELRSMDDLSALLERRAPGDEITLVTRRRTLTVQLAERPASLAVE